jgi:ectoine hydroxylase-related dioxygenase (phytanoyl-CoA dioxygenase family)
MATLSQSEVDTYQDQGYLVLRQCIKPEDLSSARVLIDELVDRHARKLYEAGKISSLHDGESFERRLAVINEEAGLKTRIFDLTEAFDSPELFSLIRHPVILDSVESLLGPEIAWTGSCAARPNLPQYEATVFPWHQDSQYYGEPTKHLHIVSVWIPLVDVDESNGCLSLIPGSHTWSLLKGERDASNTIQIFEDVEKRGKPLVLPMRKGDILFFTNLTFHTSKLNSTDKVRWSVDLRYIVPPESKTLTAQEREGYDTLYDHYKMSTITVRSREQDKIASTQQLKDYVTRRIELLAESRR